MLRVGSIVKFIRTFRPILGSGYVLDLKEIIYMSSLRHIFIYVSFGYDVIFKSFDCGVNLNESDFIIYLHGDSVDSDLLFASLCKLTLDASYEQFFYQISVILITFYLLLQNALDFSCTHLGYGVNILGIFLKRNCIIL